MDEINANIVLVIPNKNIGFIFLFWLFHMKIHESHKRWRSLISIFFYRHCDSIVAGLVKISKNSILAKAGIETIQQRRAKMLRCLPATFHQ
jgi:hypothetical protein